MDGASKESRVRRILLPVIMFGVLAGGALPAPVLARPVNPDPWEHFNRRNYVINAWLDRKIIRPVAFLSHGLTPGFIGKGIHNITTNLKEPVVILNDFLQIRPLAALKAVFRLAVNSTIGIVGAIDVAAKLRVPHHPNGFGDTLGRYGVGPGPYIFLPVLGPSDLRDLFGTTVDTASNPMTWVRYDANVDLTVGATVIGGLNTRAEADPDLKALLSDAADPYATLRSTWLQMRQGEVDDKHALPALPDLGDPAAPADQPPPPPSSAPAPADPLADPGAAPDQPHAFLSLPDQQGRNADGHVAGPLEQGQRQGKLGPQAEQGTDHGVGALLHPNAHGSEESHAADRAHQALDGQYGFQTDVHPGQAQGQPGADGAGDPRREMKADRGGDAPGVGVERVQGPADEAGAAGGGWNKSLRHPLDQMDAATLQGDEPDGGER